MKTIGKIWFMFICCSNVFCQAQITVKFKPDATVGQDAFIFTRVCNGVGDADANRNNGNHPELNMIVWTWNADGCQTGIGRSLLKFVELVTIPANATIISAELKLYGMSSATLAPQGNSCCYSGSPANFSNQSFIQRVTSTWNEQTVTWNTQPTTTTANQITIPQTTAQWNWNFTDSSVNLVAMVQDMVTNPASNFGFMMKLETEAIYRSLLFASSDHPNSALHPELIVTYIACQADTTIFNEIICEGETYSENGFNESKTGTYSIKMKNGEDCDSLIILKLNVIKADTTKFNEIICEGETYNRNGFNHSESGIYEQNLQNRFGCDSTVILTLYVAKKDTTSIFDTICEGETYRKNGFNHSKSGIYPQNLKNIYDCDSLVTLNLTVNPTPKIEIIALNDYFCEKDFIELEVITNGDSFLWESGSYGNLIVTKSGTYSATAFQGNCSKSAHYHLEECPCIFFIPNAFTPNGDGFNEVFRPFISCHETLKDYKMYIYNRWGERIFQTSDLVAGWDGTINGRDCASGVYTCVIVYTTSKNEKISKTTSVTILR